MTILIEPGYALSFNGITDGVLVPPNINMGSNKVESNRALPSALRSFTLEAWIVPDCGGIVYEYENVMRLSVGTPSSPAPASFEINLENVAAGTSSVQTINSAKPMYRPNGDLAYWDGVLFPTPSLSLHNSYIYTDENVNDSTALNDGHRELLNVTVTFTGRRLYMHINGDLVVSKEFEEDQQVVLNSSNMFLGGRGGEYRGTIEAIHLSRGIKASGRTSYAPVKSDDTIGLWRFEEPIEPIATQVVTPAISASTSASSSINIGTTAAKALAKELAGDGVTETINFTTTAPWNSQGSYTVKKYAATSTSDITIPKVPYNIIVNPLGYSSTTGKPTAKAPERLRLMAINGGAGTITVESIHLDFGATSNGRRGALQAHDIGIFVIVTGDCIVDGGNGNVYQPQGSGTQFSHRQGQVCIDESVHENHGIVFSMSMSIDSDSYNKFSASSANPGDGFYIGHSGRHVLNHVKSHPFMGTLPPATDLVVDKKLDASADVISASFSSQYSDIKGTVPINSKISTYDSHISNQITNLSFKTKVSQVVENGMSDISDSQRGIIALGGSSFNSSLFNLKSIGANSALGDSNEAIRHLVPSSESRIAILDLPSLATYDYAPFIQVHYNAVCHNSTNFSFAAASRIDSSFTSTSTIIKLQSIKSFGKNGAVIPASDFSIDGTPATTNGAITATLNHSDNKVTFSAATDSAFQAKDTTGAIVRLSMGGPSIMVTKTVPDVSTIVTGSTSILDLIHTALADDSLDIIAPGGKIEIDMPENFAFGEGALEGDTEEGTVAEPKLDFTLCPANYLPLTSTDTPAKAPQSITLANSNLSTKVSQFSKVIVSPAHCPSNLEEVEDMTRQLPTNRRISTGILINNSGGYAASTTSAMTVDGVDARTIFSNGDTVYRADGKVLGTISATVTETAITIGGGTAALLQENEELYKTPLTLGQGTTNHSTAVHEVFDIIEHQVLGKKVVLTVQPSDRRRFSQLAKLRSNASMPNSISIEYLVSRGRVLSFDDDDAGNSNLLAYGLVSDIASASVSAKGDGAPDSHIVKEIMPGAPVVTVTLGGPGQGAINTKETWDPSPTARMAWSTRRDCVTSGTASDTSARTITVVPLKNNATDLGSWGTYCFPKVGRIYLELARTDVNEGISFASAEYSSKTGTVFNFASGSHRGTGKFLLADGSEADTFSEWVSGVGSINIVGGNIHVDDKFLEESMCNDGTTINDRLFQTLDTVQHDYQLGTQYASTRAMVEIPLFDNQFFSNEDRGIFVGPDNSMKIHVDATHTASNWAPNPVGRRHEEIAPQDPEVFGAFSYSISSNSHRSGTKITKPFTDTSAPILIHVEDASIFPIPDAAPVTVAGVDGSARYRRAFLPSGEWVLYIARDTSANTITAAAAATAGGNWAMSKNFVKEFAVGVQLTPGPGYQDMNYTSIADNPLLKSAGFEGRRSFYYDRSNVMTQGGNVDYGMKQYVSAVEFRAGPRVNPHLDRIQSGRAKGIVESLNTGLNILYLKDGSDFPENREGVNGYAGYRYRLAWRNTSGTLTYAHYEARAGPVFTLNQRDSGFTPSAGDEVTLVDMHASPSTIYPEVKEGVFLNNNWANPYAPGGLRDGDTVWMNMHYTNPHSIEGLFAKSRGTLNEGEVWTGFNGGEGAMNANPRSSTPLENFLIGNTCTETAKNFVQHVNKTIELNYEALGLSATLAPTVAYLDPYQSSDEHSRVLLYDVAHDREFIAFQDLWMQVQSSADAIKIGAAPTTTAGAILHSDANSGSSLDVASGFPSQSKYLAASAQSQFMEAAYSHKSTWNASTGTILSPHSPDVGSSYTTNNGMPRTNDAVINSADSLLLHQQIDKDSREASTFFDTPDGTRAIPAFLALKGIRNDTLNLTSHEETRLQHLDHWTKMDFVRRLTVDFGEVALRDGVTNIESAAREVVRLINQAGAKNGRTYTKESDDPHLGASTGSTHDPAPFWDVEKSFSSHDRGTHMGYVRAHLGRVVQDSDGNSGYSIVIHSTVPGAEGRNFCTWLDSSRAQTPYRPQYLIGHGGRFRNYWCQPDEMTGENMHPAPMPINRFGRPFAPITTLKEFLPPEETLDSFENNLSLGPETVASSTQKTDAFRESASGRNSNTVIDESFETKSPSSTLVDGLRTGTSAKARINFGGMTQAGIPGWAPNAGKWGIGRDGDSKFEAIYGNASNAATATLGSTAYSDSNKTGYIPEADMKPSNIGDGNLYGIKLVDHRGDSHTVRMVYKQYGKSFANDLTMAPPTIDEEVIIHFDDRDVAQGGFTIGKHMVGTGEVCGEKTPNTASDAEPYKGNLWNNYPSPAVGIHVTGNKATDTGVTMDVTFTAPYSTGDTLTHPDVLGYLGFPESGVLQLSEASGVDETGITIHYTSRSHYDHDGDTGASNKHYFYGCTGGRALTTDEGMLISPRINFTSVLTDEVIAAAVEFAMTMPDPSDDSISATSFDCTGMFAPDGKTLGEWGVSPTAIRIKSSSKNKVPLSKLFEVSRSKDWGLVEGASSDAAVGSKHTGGLSDSERDAGTRLDVGYIPETVLHITTRYKGTNANTATPILVDNQNNPVDISTWQRNLRGDNYTSVAGDHIIPKVDSPMILKTTDDGTLITTASSTYLYSICVPGSDHAQAWGERFTIWWGSEEYAEVTSTPGTAVETKLTYGAATGVSTNFASFCHDSDDEVLMRNGDVKNGMKTDGIRRAGSKMSSPFLYFRGGRDSPDHWVPLYFGGGFSGVVMDVNDGTQNDYGDFYTHPYAGGPTGSAGLQNIGEVAGAYALLDTNAMLAMFPGTPYLDNHRGKNNPPMFNQDGILPFDMAKGANNHATGTTYTDGTNTVSTNIPSPIILRFGHPHARYSAAGNTADQTIYMVFGPGQAFPHNSATFEPQGSNIVTTGNGYSAVPIYTTSTSPSFLPNQLANGDDSVSGFNRTLAASAHLPRTSFFQKNRLSAFNYDMNWEPTKGFPSVATHTSSGDSFAQGYNKAFYYEGSDFTIGSLTLPPTAHPFNHVFTNLAGGALESATYPASKKAFAIWHMDGGYHPGGHFLDNHVNINPKHPVENGRLATGSANKHNVSAFRPCGLLAKAYLAKYDTDGDPEDQVSDENVVLIDATRVQNAEELGAVISASINTFPGKDPLKAIGGTFLPSMQNAHKQDRYGWVELAVASYTAQNGLDPASATAASLVATSTSTTLPPYGWLRVSDGTTSGYAPYVGYSVSAPNTTFTLGKGPAATTPKSVTVQGGTSGTSGYSAASGLATTGGSGTGLTIQITSVNGSGQVTGATITASGSGYNSGEIVVIQQGGSSNDARLELVLDASSNVIDPTNNRHVAVTNSFKVYVWTKAGTHRHNNDSGVTARDHMTQVHYNGLIDAVDRTKPIGAVGWAGEAYSYMNSYTGTQVGSGVYPAGLGAWHPFLGFNPYGAAETCLAASAPVGTGDTATATFSEYCVNGLSSRHLIAITNESELPLIAKADRDGILCSGDWLMAKENGNILHAGTTQWDTDKVHNKSRYVAYANAGPRVEVQVHSDFVRPFDASDYPATSAVPADNKWHATIASGKMVQLNSCLHPTGDLYWDESIVKGSNFHEDFATYGVECIGNSGLLDYLNPGAATTAMPHPGLFGYYDKRSAARNFSAEHVVWKRMDGGSLTMPAANARGLGAIPWVQRKVEEGSYELVGEKILGNVRFSFESTNSAMFPVIQAQELAHPQLAEQHPKKIRNALMIPNEELQFQSMMVVDDTGQEHRLEGGSPLGTVIMDFRHVSDREIEGLAPALAGTGISPNMKIRLPNPDEIPGNIIIRPGFDRIQAYQNETFGSGGLQHPAQAKEGGFVRNLFDNQSPGPRLWPTWENNGWEHLSQDRTDVSTTKHRHRLGFPASTSEGWEDYTGHKPLTTAYEPHDRSLYFHVTKMGVTSTHRYGAGECVYLSHTTNTIVTDGETLAPAIWTDTTEQSGGRYFLRLYNQETDNGVIVSYTGISSNTFTGVVFSPEFETFVQEQENSFHQINITPSYYMPAGSTRIYASRRLRDHSEYSGASPDMKITDWFEIYDKLPASSGSFTNPSVPYIHLAGTSSPKMTPMPIPRMGHHYVNPTMALMPGHYAHPAYQRLYELNQSCRTSNNAPAINSLIGTNEATRTSVVEAATGTITVADGDAAHGLTAGQKVTITSTDNKIVDYFVSDTGDSGVAHLSAVTAGATLKSTGSITASLTSGATGISVGFNLSSGTQNAFLVLLKAAIEHANGHNGRITVSAVPAEANGAQSITVTQRDHGAEGNVTMTENLATGSVSGFSGGADLTTSFESGRDPYIYFSGPTAAFAPSDIHGGGFTLLTETKIKYEGYGVAASVGDAGSKNAAGGHELVLEAAGTYTLNNHFPDPMEVGAYQIVIQPNVFAQQLKGFHANGPATDVPDGSVVELTGQQVNTVIAIEQDISTNGAHTLILAEAIMADVRGCEIIINEVILDIEPDSGSHFANMPALGLYNPLGVQESSSPSLSRRSLPYKPGMFSSATPGYTVTIPWWGILHKDGAGDSAAQKFRHLEWHKPDNYYEFCRMSYGCVGAQLTIAGYPTSFMDIYEAHRRNRSLNPTCVVLATDSSGSTITVDNNDLFPVAPYYGEKLEYTKSGKRYTATYGNRTGTLAHATLGVSTIFSSVSGSAEFWANIAADTVLKLTRPYDTYASDSVFLDTKSSIMTRLLPQRRKVGEESIYTSIANGTADTNSLHLPDAYLCMWHPNLGRPFTWYSDTATGGTRNFYDKTGVADTPVDKKPYNHIPEHFETIHYHDFNYVASKGPFGLAMKWLSPPGSAGLSADGTIYTAAQIDSDGNLSHQGGTDSSEKYNFAGFWPGGSHGGGAISRLEAYGDALIGWGGETHGMDCGGFDDNTGVRTRTYAQLTSASAYARNNCFGFRFGLRQAYNRPRWANYVRGWLEVANANALLGYYNGPLVQQDDKAGGWDYVGTDTGTIGDSSISDTYIGILERLTQVSALLNQDQIGRQVRYSDGRRMSEPFGCAVRTIRNASTVRREYPGDNAGKGISELADAHRYYMVDWWGNTRGEDVRRFPVRGFGIRPSWDPEDAYADTNVAHRPAAGALFGGDGNDRYSGNANTANNDASNMGVADWFNPASALRVGDRGDGRGVRWPTVFNESMLMDVSETHDATGLVLSHSTAEPAFGQGLVRPSNLTLQSGEIERGISARLDLADEDGLLKPSASVGEGVETVTADTRLVDPVARDDMRMGLDVDTIAELNDGVSREYVIMSTEAASLHTDREVGQRTNLRGAMTGGSRTLGDFDLTALNFSTNPVAGITRFSNAHAYWPLGGTYIMEWSRYSGVLDVKGWGRSLPTSGMTLWLKADSLDLEDGDAVTTWEDVSGNGHVFAQTTESQQPDFVASDSDYNNKPHVHFDGDDAIPISPWAAGLNPSNFTVFIVSTVDSDDGNYHGIVQNTYLNTGWLLYARMSGSNNYWQWRTGTGSGTTIISAGTDTVVPNKPSIVTLKMSGSDGAGGGSTTQTLYVNGKSEATSSAVYTKQTTRGTTLGDVGSFELTGQMAEVIIYDRPLTDFEQKQVESYLSEKYSIGAGYLTSTSNPYQTLTHDPTVQNTNFTDSTIDFLYRPTQVLDSKHVQFFRPAPVIKSGADQVGSNFYRATAGGKYGLFTSDAPGALTGTPSSPPYAPVYSILPTSSTTVPISQGPKIEGVDVTGYDKADIRSPVARVVMSENTLEHFRADASRKSPDDEEGDFTVQPRHSQTLHPKGSDGDATYNTGRHDGE